MSSFLARHCEDSSDPHPPVEELDTPDTPTIETLAATVGVPASATLKNLLVLAARAQHAAGRMLMCVIDLAHVAAAQRDGECVGHADGCCHLLGWCGRRSGPRVRAGTR